MRAFQNRKALAQGKNTPWRTREEGLELYLCDASHIDPLLHPLPEEDRFLVSREKSIMYFVRMSSVYSAVRPIVIHTTA